MKCKAIIISIKGTRLTKREKILFSKYRPWGVILFKRNLKTIKQIKHLILNIKKLTKNNKFPILIDEEGIRMSRLTEIISHKFTAQYFGDLYKRNKTFCENIYRHYIYSLSKTLRDLGFNINTIPVLDIKRIFTNKIIGERSFSNDKKIVRELGKITIQFLHKNKIAGVIKHIPGHGCAISDSHKKMPIVRMSIKRLNNFDFQPFKLSKAKFAMTAHILYKEIDNKNVATFSEKIIKQIIRKKMRFKGILMSDDISMKALKFNLVKNAKKSLQSGCNLVLYCSGNTSDNLKLIKSLPYIDSFTSKKTSEFYKFLG